MLDHDIISTIRSSETQTDEHLRCVTSALMVGTRVCPREPLPEPAPLSRALVEMLWQARGWR